MALGPAALKRPGHRCGDCGHSSPRWFGRCPQCGTFGSALESSPGGGEAVAVTSLAAPGATPDRFSTGIPEVDRVLGGGLVPGSVVLLAGEPGIGKSTLVLQLLDGVLGSGRPALLVSGEESLAQVSLRGRRLGVDLARFRVAAASSLETVLALAEAERPCALVVDSIQTLQSDEANQPAGSVPQVRAAAAALVGYAKRTGTVVILIGHVTKDGTVAGPKTLEHIVDVVLGLEGERTGTIRLLRAAKNRFGSCEETGVFVMAERGLDAVGDPSSMLLAGRQPDVPGSVVFPVLEGTRPVLVELQALVAESDLAQPRRVAIGLDSRRLAMLIAVLHGRAGVDLKKLDVFVAAAGGLAVREPAADLGLALAMCSVAAPRPIDAGAIVVGEIGLAGEVRRVPGIERRLVEAARMGFTTAVVPHGVERVPPAVQTIPVANVAEAIGKLSCVPGMNARHGGEE